MGRLTSAQVRLLLLVPLSDSKVWHIDALRQWIEEHVPLTTEDRMPYPDRPSEERWYASIDNALSQSRPSSLIGIGEVGQPERGYYQITTRGREEAQKVIAYLRSKGREKIVSYVDGRK